VLRRRRGKDSHGKEVDGISSTHVVQKKKILKLLTTTRKINKSSDKMQQAHLRRKRTRKRGTATFATSMVIERVSVRTEN